MNAEEYLKKERAKSKSFDDISSRNLDWNFYDSKVVNSNNIDLMGSYHGSIACTKYINKLFEENNYDGVFLELCPFRLSTGLTGIKRRPFLIRKNISEEDLSKIYFKNKELFNDSKLPKVAKKINKSFVDSKTGFNKTEKKLESRDSEADMYYALIRAIENNCSIYAIDNNVFKSTKMPIIQKILINILPSSFLPRMISLKPETYSSSNLEDSVFTELDVTGEYILKNGQKVLTRKNVGKNEKLELLKVYGDEDGMVTVESSETGEEQRVFVGKKENSVNNFQYQLVKAIMTYTDPEDLSEEIKIEEIVRDSQIETRAKNHEVDIENLINLIKEKYGENYFRQKTDTVKQGANKVREEAMSKRVSEILKNKENKNYLMIIGAAHYENIVDKLSD